MKRCLKCIIPETAHGIVFDNNGVCQLCRDFKSYSIKGEQSLIEAVKPFKEKENRYNCVVPVSGGRDSSYALYYAKEVLELKPLAVHSDNDFETEIATKNLINITNSVDVPLIRVGSKERLLKKIVTEKFKMNSYFGAWRVVEQTCEACKYGFESASYNAARKEGIQLIIWGDSTEESTASYHSLAKHEDPTKWERYFSPGVLNFLKYKYYFKKLQKEYGLDSPDGLSEIHLYDYVKWDREVIVNTIQDKMGWTKPEESATSWRIDCSLVPIVNFLTEKAFGVSKIELGFSQMIRSGKMNREDALKQVEIIKSATNLEEIRNFLKGLDISEPYIDRVIK